MLPFLETVKKSGAAFQERIALEWDVLEAASAYRHNPTEETKQALDMAVDRLEAFESSHGGRRKR